MMGAEAGPVFLFWNHCLWCMPAWSAKFRVRKPFLVLDVAILFIQSLKLGRKWSHQHQQCTPQATLWLPTNDGGCLAFSEPCRPSSMLPWMTYFTDKECSLWCSKACRHRSRNSCLIGSCELLSSVQSNLCTEHWIKTELNQGLEQRGGIKGKEASISERFRVSVWSEALLHMTPRKALRVGSGVLIFMGKKAEAQRLNTSFKNVQLLKDIAGFRYFQLKLFVLCKKQVAWQKIAWKCCSCPFLLIF